LIAEKEQTRTAVYQIGSKDRFLARVIADGTMRFDFAMSQLCRWKQHGGNSPQQNGGSAQSAAAKIFVVKRSG